MRSSSAPLIVGKHFDLDIKDDAFSFCVNEERLAAEAALDGIYVIRTSAAEAEMSPEAAVLNYKRLAEVERAFRTLAALAKAQTRRLGDGTPALSFRGLLSHLATIVRNTMRAKDAKPGMRTFTLTTEANPKQRQALDLAAAIAA